MEFSKVLCGNPGIFWYGWTWYVEVRHCAVASCMVRMDLVLFGRLGWGMVCSAEVRFGWTGCRVVRLALVR